MARARSPAADGSAWAPTGGPASAAPARSSAARSRRRSGEDRRDLVNVDRFFDATQAVVHDGRRRGLETGGKDAQEDRDHQQRAQLVDRARHDLGRDLLNDSHHKKNAKNLPAEALGEIGAAPKSIDDPRPLLDGNGDDHG